MSKKKRVEIASSFTVKPGGVVDEVTWTQEDRLLRALKHDPRDEERFMTARRALRQMAKDGRILYRRNPEHGFWEYGPQWRAKGFRIDVEGAQEAIELEMLEAEERTAAEADLPEGAS